MKTIVIIGGGFSGTLTAIQLLKKSKDVQVIIINTNYPIAKGTAYSTNSAEHLLNVTARQMSPFSNEPDHFVSWIRSGNSSYSNSDIPFLPRFLYGKYIQELFEPFKTNKQLQIIEAKATDIQTVEKKYSVILDNGQSILADKIVLAMGNFLPANPKIKDPSFFKSKNYFQNPWVQSYLKDIKPNEPILILGTGLTMVDCVLSLIAAGQKGQIYVVSPRGYTPVSHVKSSKYPDFYEEIKESSLLEILKSVRKHIKIATSKNISWQAVIDSIRPHVQKIWLRLSQKEKQQFISHLRHIWGVARHRLPVVTYDQLIELKEKGLLEIIGGRITDLQEQSSSIVAKIRLRKGKTKELIVSRIINCTGPQLNFLELKDELIQNLLSKKFIIADELKMGLQSSIDGRVIEKENKVSSDIYAIGSLLRGVLWETTSVPDIRVQAESIAQQIVESIKC